MMVALSYVSFVHFVASNSVFVLVSSGGGRLRNMAACQMTHLRSGAFTSRPSVRYTRIRFWFSFRCVKYRRKSTFSVANAKKECDVWPAARSCGECGKLMAVSSIVANDLWTSHWARWKIRYFCAGTEWRLRIYYQPNNCRTSSVWAYRF